jgi:hypothetical protein
VHMSSCSHARKPALCKHIKFISIKHLTRPAFAPRLCAPVSMADLRYGMSADAIRILNKLIGTALFPGQRLVVKDPDAAEQFALFDAIRQNSPLPHAHRRGKEPAADGAGAAAAGDKDGGDGSGEMSPFFMVSKTPFADKSEPVKEFANTSGTAFRVKVLYMTKGKGLIPGFLEADENHVRFWPEKSGIIDEFGQQVRKNSCDQ